jgi:hypothetical protein
LRTETVNKFAVFIDQEFFKVPLDFTCEIRIWCFCEVFKQRGNIVAFNADLFTKRKRNTIVLLAESFDVRSSAWFLLAKVICREPDNDDLVLIKVGKFL